MTNRKEEAPKEQNLLPVADRIRGGIAFLLTIAAFTGGANTHSAQWQVSFMLAGFLFMLTTLGIMFEKTDFMESEEENDAHPDKSE